jgi:hypothetical protein
MFTLPAANIIDKDHKSVALVQKLKGLLTEKLIEHRQHQHCGEACLAKRRRIAAQMKALQRQINSDYKNMINFGHKAGYVPPVKSIKQQVMDGTLLSSGDEDSAPPPFDPNVDTKQAKRGSGEQKSLRSEESHNRKRHRQKKQESRTSDQGSLSLPQVHSVDEMAHEFMSESDSGVVNAKVQTKHHHTHIDVPTLGRVVKFHSSHDKSSAKWKKLFSFIDKEPHDEAPKDANAPRTTIPSAVKRAIQRVSSSVFKMMPSSSIFIFPLLILTRRLAGTQFCFFERPLWYLISFGLALSEGAIGSAELHHLLDPIGEGILSIRKLWQVCRDKTHQRWLLTN